MKRHALSHNFHHRVFCEMKITDDAPMAATMRCRDGVTIDMQSFVGRTVKYMDTTLRMHQTVPPPSASMGGVSSISDLLAELTDEDAESSVRRRAALKIGQRADVDRADVARVVAELTNAHNCQVGGGAMSVRRAALLALTELAQGADGVPAAVISCMPELACMLRHDDADAREMAVRAMGALGSHADALAVAACLEDGEYDVRSAAADTLVSLAPTLGPPELGAIAARLRYEDDDDVRSCALRTLAGIGPAAASQTSAVLACLDDEGTMALTPPSRALAVAALAALGRGGGGGGGAAAVTAATQQQQQQLVLARVESMLEDEEGMVRAAALEALAQLGGAERHADAVSELLCDAEKSVRNAATATLKKWGMA